MRVLEGELMDAPDLADKPHRQALQGLRRVNMWSGTASILARGIASHIRQARVDAQPLKILDLACGGGDVTLGLTQRLTAAGLSVETHGWDRSPTAVDVACEEASRRGLDRQVQFAVRDAISLSPADGFDVITCTLFLHHLSNEETKSLLAMMFAAAHKLVIVDDLRRTRFGYRLAQLGCTVLSRSPIVHVDGPLSVRAAYREEELLAIATELGVRNGEYRRHWPQRFLMWWPRS
ncbi:MAG: methyltransferase domain-containing protein [Pirellulales bacterium]